MTESHQDNVLRGILYVCGAFFCFTAMQAVAKLMIDRHDVIEIAFWRNVIACVPFIGFVVYKKNVKLLAITKRKALFGRVVIGTAGLVLTFAAAQAMPLANATVLFFTATLLLPIFAAIFLREKIGRHRITAIIIGMCGVLLVAQPDGNVTMIGVAFGLGAAFCHAIIQTFMRHLKTESSFAITFYFLAGSVLILGVFMPWFYDPVSLGDWGLMIGVGILGTGGQLFLAMGFKNAPASLLNPFNYTGLLWATGFDIMIWGHMPAWYVYAGGAVIIGSQLYILHRERVLRQTRPPETLV